MQTAFNLLNRLSPTETYKFIDIMTKYKPELEDLKSQFDSRFEKQMDPEKNQEFICCPYNNENGIYRSPYTNKLTNGQESEFPLSARGKEIQEYANKCLKTYATQYFGATGLSNCFVWEENNQLFNAAVVVQSDSWTATHVFTFSASAGKWNVDLNSSMLLAFSTNAGATVEGAKRRNKQFQITIANPLKGKEFVVRGISKIEEIETQILGTLWEVYYGNSVEAAKKLAGKKVGGLRLI